MKYSIIVPVYNTDQYLSECLESILAQTYRNFEIICINDASTDDSLQILKTYEENYKYITVINNVKNMGPSCRNEGIKIAKGEYILFVDSDDYVHQDTLQVIDKFLRNDPIDILEFGCNVISGGIYSEENALSIKNISMEIVNPVTGIQWFVQRQREKSYLGIVCARVFRREFLRENHLVFYRDILHEDELFMLHCVIKARAIISIKDLLYIYRRRDNSITTQKNKIKNLDSLVIILNEALVLWRNIEEKEAQSAFEEYARNRLKTIKYLMLRYPEHKSMMIGTVRDQFLFDLIYAMDDILVRKKKEFTEAELFTINRHRKILIYGAGVVAIEILQLLKRIGKEVDGIIVSHEEINEDELLGCKISQVEKCAEESADVLIIVAVAQSKQKVIVDNLQNLNYKNILCIER